MLIAGIQKLDQSGTCSSSPSYPNFIYVIVPFLLPPARACKKKKKKKECEDVALPPRQNGCSRYVSACVILYVCILCSIVVKVVTYGCLSELHPDLTV